MQPAQKLLWTAERVKRFWDYWAQRRDAPYFASLNGRGVVNFLEHATQLPSAQVLDFGAGAGHLAQHLLRRACLVSAVDYSPDSVSQLNRRFSHVGYWQGARLFDGRRLPWPDETFDVVCCLETIEHVEDEYQSLIFCELQRVLRTGGVALFTTPNEERLEAEHVYCPTCNSEFHRWQHLRSWSARSLSSLLEQHGFDVRFCRGMDFRSFQEAAAKRWDHVSLNDIKRALKLRVRQIQDRLLPRPFPRGRVLHTRLGQGTRNHLAAVAVKRQAAAEAERRGKPVGQRPLVDAA